MNNTKYEVW